MNRTQLPDCLAEFASLGRRAPENPRARETPRQVPITLTASGRECGDAGLGFIVGDCRGAQGAQAEVQSRRFLGEVAGAVRSQRFPQGFPSQAASLRNYDKVIDLRARRKDSLSSSGAQVLLGSESFGVARCPWQFREGDMCLVEFR